LCALSSRFLPQPRRRCQWPRGWLPLLSPLAAATALRSPAFGRCRQPPPSRSMLPLPHSTTLSRTPLSLARSCTCRSRSILGADSSCRRSTSTSPSHTSAPQPAARVFPSLVALTAALSPPLSAGMVERAAQALRGLAPRATRLAQCTVPKFTDFQCSLDLSSFRRRQRVAQRVNCRPIAISLESGA
jgi:hypothetical protein